MGRIFVLRATEPAETRTKEFTELPSVSGKNFSVGQKLSGGGRQPKERCLTGGHWLIIVWGKGH